MKRQFFLALCLLLLPVTLLTGCWQEDPLYEHNELLQSDADVPEEPPSAGALPERFALPYAPDLTLDPITCADGMQQVVSSLLCEGLFRLSPALEPENVLCERYTYDPDTFTYVFTLKRGVLFSDGTPLTPSDVRATLLRAAQSARYSARLSDAVKISADETAVTVVLSAPNTAFPALLDIPIVKSGSEAHVPIGTGPYLFTRDSSGTYLVANQSWWQGSSQPVDRIPLTEASDQNSMLYRFSSRDIQLLTTDLTGTAPLTAAGSVTHHEVNTTLLQYIGCNTQRAPLNDAAFRRALWSGIQRETLVSAFLSGHGVPTQFPISPVSALYPAELEEPYSPETFPAAVAATGYEATRTLSLLVNSENSFKLSVAQQIADSFSAAGVPVAVKALPWEEYTAALLSGSFDFYFGEVKLTADWDLSPLLATDGALNHAHWSDPQTDYLLSAFAAADDRSAAARRLCSHLKFEAVILPVCFKSTTVLVQDDVITGLTPTMAEVFYDLPSCSVHLQTP